MNGVIIYLIGFAGCGKLTIARAIQARFDCILVDNHYVNNVIFSLIDPDGRTPLPARVWQNVDLVRTAVFDTIRHLSKPGRSFIFTNVLFEGGDIDQQIFLDIAGLAQDRGALFLPVRLLISPEELVRRVVSPDRAQKLKETDPQAAREKALEQEVFRPVGFPYLEIDITTLSPDEVADRILLEISKRQPQ